jgi:hypothetical protein
MFYPATVPASASRVRISHLVIKNTADTLLIDLKIDSDFVPKMKAAVLNGVPIRFTITVSLYEVNDLWFDKKVAVRKAVHELRYDAMRKAFKIKRSRGMPQTTYIEDFDSARLCIFEITDLSVASLTDLKRGRHYQLMVGTVLSLKKFHLINFFQELKTDRYTVNFPY